MPTTAPSVIGKHCPGCGTVLPWREFGLDPRNKSGRKSRCQPCLASRQRRDRARRAPKVEPVPKAKGNVSTNPHIGMAEREYRRAELFMPKADKATQDMLAEYLPVLSKYIQLTRQGREPSELWQLAKLGYRFGEDIPA